MDGHPPRKFYGTVSKVGNAATLKLDLPQDWQERVALLVGERVEITIQRQETRRSIDQNNYYHGAVLPVLAEYWNESRDSILPVHDSVVHHEMKRSFLGVDEDGEVVHSKDRNTRAFAKMTDDIRNFLATKGKYVESPEEWAKRKHEH